MKTHGLRYTREYAIWSNAKRRCHNPKDNHYDNYGGRGIEMCESWRDSFVNFYNDMGKRPSKKYTLDRIDNNGNYEKLNCRWATYKEQGNNKRNNIWLEYNGERHTLSGWARKLKVSKARLSDAIKKYNNEL